MTAATDNFFDESREQSMVKAEIVEKYFDAWAGIITGTQDRFQVGEKRIAYVDLFAGPGRYKDGAIFADDILVTFPRTGADDVSWLRRSPRSPTRISR